MPRLADHAEFFASEAVTTAVLLEIAPVVVLTMDGELTKPTNTVVPRLKGRDDSRLA